MENLKKVSRARWCLFALFIGFAFLMQNCSDDDAVIYEENQIPAELSSKGQPVKVTVCRHNLRKDTYSIVTVVAKNVLDGDIIIDADGDGYVNANQCILGNGIDCDDTNPAIHPSALEICGDGLDNNCDGISEDCRTYVPDDNFEQALIDLSLDNELDDYVDNANINTVTSLYIYDKGISDLTGIGGFTNLEILSCWYNNLISLDLSQNTALIELECSYNALTSLDISNCANLTELGCYSNQLEILDVSHNIHLTNLDFSYNKISNIDLSLNSDLIRLSCGENYIVNLNIYNCEFLQDLSCGTNQIQSLDVSNNLALIYLECQANDLRGLDVSSNTALTKLMCHSNPNLGCIQVTQYQIDTYISGWSKDVGASFSTECPS